MKTAELTGALLDYWVARADGRNPAPVKVGDRTVYALDHGKGFQVPFYSTDWAQGGPILERMRLLEATGCVGGTGWYVRGPWRPCDGDQVYGDTLLEAAMRAYVASKFGDEVPEDAAIQAAAQGEKA